MIRLVWRSVRFARGRVLALGAGVLVASVAFSLLTATVSAQSARVKGVVGANWRGAYDLLVLPAGSVGPGGTRRLVQVNYLSAAASGITLAQYRRIASLPGVGVAAPLEVVGYALETAAVPVTLTPAALGSSGAKVFVLSSRYSADRGLSSFPARAEGYVYLTPNAVTPLVQALPLEHGGVVGPLEVLPGGRSVIVCPSGGGRLGRAASPFGRDFGYENGQCVSRRGPGAVRGMVEWSFPVLIAGIDPGAENALTGLGKAVSSGRYLRQREGLAHPASADHAGVLPVLGSAVSFSGDRDQVAVSLLPPRAVRQVRSGDQRSIAKALAADRGTVVQTVTITGAQAWSELLRQLSAPLRGPLVRFAQSVDQYWTAGPVRYRRGAGGVLVPVPVRNPVSVWTDHAFSQGYVSPPPSAADTGFRVLAEHQPAGRGGGVMLRAVGEFDPARLGGFSGGGPGAPLASYRAPVLTGADARSRSLLGNQPLLPGGNMAGYAQMPPLLYTTLAAAAALEDPARFKGTAGQSAAPIGSVRVRVAGLRGGVRSQLAKVAAVGSEIREATGLDVVVTAGASQQGVTVDLPAGKFGRPELALRELWTQTQVALVVLNQVDRESLALFLLILVVSGLFLAGASFAGVRGRRAEIGTLRALGWGNRQVFVWSLAEVLTLGILAGAVGTAVSAALVAGLGLKIALWRSALVLPVAAGLAMLAGLAPAALAARTRPMAALGGSARAPRRKGRRVTTVAGLAMAEVARVPGRFALAGTGLAFGVAALGILLAAHQSFATSIGDSSLAGLVTATTRGSDLVSAALTVALSAAGLADVVYLNQRERSAELAALAASGWSRAQLGRLLGYEAVLTSVAGSIAGAAAGLAVAGTAFGISAAVIAGVGSAAIGGVLISVAVCATVLSFTARRPIAAVLAADE